MNPIHRLAQQILSEWAQELAHHLGRSVQEICSKGLDASDFSSNECLHIQLADDSFVQFEYAFHVVNPEKCAMAVFTEHCGYFVFPIHGAVVSRIQREVLDVQEQ